MPYRHVPHEDVVSKATSDLVTERSYDSIRPTTTRSTERLTPLRQAFVVSECLKCVTDQPGAVGRGLVGCDIRRDCLNKVSVRSVRKTRLRPNVYGRRDELAIILPPF